MFSDQVKGLSNILEERGVCTLKTAHKVGRIWLDQQARSCGCSEITQKNKLDYGQGVYHIQLLRRSGVFRPAVIDVCSFYTQRAGSCMLRIWMSKYFSVCLTLSSHKVPLKLMTCIFKGDTAEQKSALLWATSYYSVPQSCNWDEKPTEENAERLRMGVCPSTALCANGARPFQ